MGVIDVNGTTLYYELRGDGPPLLLITGATGDAGHWTSVADALADEYTVLTYDRRGNSRSPARHGWAAAPVHEQAEDAAALLTALHLAPALAWGISTGAIYLTELVLHRPDLLRGAVFQEPPYRANTSHPEAVGATIQALVEQGMARGGPPAATEAYLRWACGDQVFEAFDPELRDRCLGNGEVLFGLELPAVRSYLPDPAELAQVRLPCAVTSGADNREPTTELHWFREAAQWFADQLRVPLVETAGAHVPQASHPEALVATLRPILRRFLQDPARPQVPSSMG